MNRADWPTPEQTPLVSVIMPVRNERNAIQQTVESVLNQDYAPERLELLVADGMSNDGTREILDEIASRDPRVWVVENRQQIMAAGFNIGLTRAQGTIILMMGGHTQIAGDYISTCSRLLLSGIADCVGGPIETACRDDRDRGIAAVMSSRFGVGGASFRIGCERTKYVDTVAFGAYSRGVIQRAGGLDEELVRNQDDEFNYRIRKLGGRILISPELRCRYFGRSSLWALWRQYFQYGFWKVRVLQKHPRQMRPRQFAPALLVSALATFSFAGCEVVVHRHCSLIRRR